ncbi:putative methylmalonate-semialdehyde dehydrogenase [acylating], mitochondrial-like [Capsicum annuum]|nr:putative methylmalonate-semialdehyde dehydrogenase [acylating], mitochondrial-like [Capsicum annuum]KAF3676844.1 putative methylmalonate-semialdehyde dehydrogenase [acylating], mitochondrial-like [Capsicum annuum]
MFRSKILSIFLFLVFFVIPSLYSLNFNLTNITPSDVNRYISITGDAYISNQGIQVTPDERYIALDGKTGRATYIEPLQLWNKATGKLTDFTTHFSFVIDSNGNDSFADGLAFFLAPVGSSVPVGSSGSGLGLVDAETGDKSSHEPFVAIEFDTFKNNWDPSPVHVGININSMDSVATKLWNNDITLGKKNDAWITYNASSKALEVVFTGFDKKYYRDKLRYVVDLRDYLPENVSFGFSASTGQLFQKNNVKSWDFISSLSFDAIKVPGHAEQPSASPPAQVQNPRNPPIHVQDPKDHPQEALSTKRKGNSGLVVGSSIGLPVLILGLITASCFLWKKKRKGDNKDPVFVDLDMDDEFEKGTGPKRFSYGELVRATNNFAAGQKLGEGGFGDVYKGLLKESNSYIAVKRVSKGSKQGIKEYASEVKIISRLRHRNLVQLIGWCHEKGQLHLVYELMPNASLDKHLFKENSLLVWEIRWKIAQGIASALLYLHEEWEQCVVHRDIKASNVMLDSNFNAKLGDFGLARLVDHEKGSQTTMLAGTVGYMAPECVMNGKASKESDVYSFGIVALEIASGRRSIDIKVPEDQVRLVEWVWRLYGTGELVEATDPRLNKMFSEKEMERLMVVGLWCAHPDNKLRPSIRQAIHVLNSEALLPILPSRMPVATYSPPPLNMFSPPFSHTYEVSKTMGSELEQTMTYTISSSVYTSSAASSTKSLL